MLISRVSEFFDFNKSSILFETNFSEGFHVELYSYRSVYYICVTCTLLECCRVRYFKVIFADKKEREYYLQQSYYTLLFDIYNNFFN